MTALIDADSIIYIIGWAHKDDTQDMPGMIETVQSKCDAFFQYLIHSTKANKYIGVFSDRKSFRNELYRVAPYKGTRPPKPEWVREWENVIKNYFETKYSFKTCLNLEADDVVSLFTELVYEPIICSPDKDLKQIAGNLFDYKKNEHHSISQEEALRFFYIQLLTGDSSDNVKGVPGLGEVKAKKLLESIEHELELHSIVQDAYRKYYGDFYGHLIFDETFATLKMLSKTHPKYKELVMNTFQISELIAPKFDTELDESILSELGW